MMTLPQIKMMLYDLETEQRGLKMHNDKFPDDREGERALQLVSVKVELVKEILETDKLNRPE